MNPEIIGDKDAANEIISLIEEWTEALRTKDTDKIAKHYTENALVYDLGSQTNSKEEYKALWNACMPYFGDEILLERKRVRIYASPELAFVHFYSQISGAQTEDPSAKYWFRNTVCYHKVNGAWKVVHEHCSTPIDFEQGKPKLIMDLD